MGAHGETSKQPAHGLSIAPLLARKLAAMLTHGLSIAPLLARKLAAMLTHGRPRGRRLGAAAVAITVLIAGAGFSGSAAAVADVSLAQGDFLTGSGLGVDLGTLVAVQGASAANVGSPAVVEQSQPLDVSAVSQVNVNLGSGVNLLGTGGLLALGPANQYARANSDGSSSAASGAVTDTGALSVGSGGPQGQASLNLSPLLGTAGASSALSAAQVSADAIAGTATETAGGAQSGGYALRNLTLAFTSPLVSGIKTSLAPTVATAQAALHDLPNNPIIQALCPPIGVCLLAVDEPDLSATVNALTSITTSGGAVTAGLDTGAVQVDIAGLLAFHGKDLNTLAPNTDLSSLVQSELAVDLTIGLQSALTTLSTNLTDAINSTGVTLAGLPIPSGVLTAALTPILTATTTGIQPVLSQVGSTVAQPLVDALGLLMAMTANNQAASAGTFTETALRIGLVPALGLATVNLAAASVGPNAGPLAPTASGLNPASGPTVGGTIVTINGANFLPGATLVTIGGVTLPAGFATVAPDGASLTFATPPHPAGAVAVTVATPGGTSAPALSFSYLDVPAATGITPDTGPIAGGTGVIIDGANFVPGASTVSIGGITVPAGSVTVLAGGTSLTFVTPPHSAGAVPVIVTTGGGSSAPPLTFSYLAVPTATGLTPDAGPAAGGQTVSLSGSGFVAGQTSITIGGGVIAPASVTVDPSGNSLTFSTPAHAPGPVQVTATTPGGNTAPLGYSYLDVPAPASLNPTEGPVAGGQTVTMTGSGFVPAQTWVSIDGTVIPVGSVTVDPSGSSLTFLTPAHAAGPVQVTATTPGGTTAPLDYSYLPVPTAASLNPVAGPSAGGQTVAVTGSGFVAGLTTATIGGIVIAAGSVTVDPSGNSLTFLTPAHAAGAVPVTVTTPGGDTTPSLAYLYVDPPTSTSLAPPSGAVSGGTTVTIVGTNFVPGLTAVIIGGLTVPSGSVTVAAGGASLTFATPAHPLGPVTATVATPGGTTGPQPFEYLPLPTEGTLSPAAGPVAGGQTVTVTGSAFLPGLTAVSIGGLLVPAGSVAVNPAGTDLTFVTPPHAAGTVDVTTMTPAGVTAPLAYDYLPLPAAPVITAPADGSTVTDGLPVISGTGSPGATVTVTEGSIVLCTARVQPAGTWSCTPSGPLVDGSHTITAAQSTIAGTSPASAPVTFIVAVSPTIEGMTPVQGLTAGGMTVTIVGTGFVVGHTSVTIGGITVPADVAAQLSIAPTAALNPHVAAAGTSTSLTFSTPAHRKGPVWVTVTTATGTTAPRTFTYLPPPVAPPVITSPGNGANTGANPPISGTGVPGSTVTVTDGGTSVCAAIVAADGTWTCTPATGLSSGTHTISATESNSDGTSAASAPITFTVAMLASTGQFVDRSAGLALLLLVSGLVLVLAARLPRQRRMPAPVRPVRGDPRR